MTAAEMLFDALTALALAVLVLRPAPPARERYR